MVEFDELGAAQPLSQLREKEENLHGKRLFHNCPQHAGDPILPAEHSQRSDAEWKLLINLFIISVFFPCFQHVPAVVEGSMSSTALSTASLQLMAHPSLAGQLLCPLTQCFNKADVECHIR